MKSAPVFLHIALAFAGIACNWRKPKPLISLQLYLAFVVIGAGSGWYVLLVDGQQSPVYFRAYWTLEFLNNILLLFMATELISLLLPKRFVFWWASFFLAMLFLTIRPSLPLTTQGGYLRMAIAADAVAAVILAAMALFQDIEWTRDRAIIAAGVVATVLGNALPAWGFLEGVSGAALVQVGSLAGLVCFVWAGCVGSDKKKAVAA